jgi:hypothetical protein
MRNKCKARGEWRWQGNKLVDELGDVFDLCRALVDSELVAQGVKGWEHRKQLGQVQHVYLLRIGRSLVRILSPSIKPSGQFSFPMPEEITFENTL